MRAEYRIRVILDALRQVWEKLPNLTFGQFLYNVATDPALYYIEDGELLASVIDYYGDKVEDNAIDAEAKKTFIEALISIWTAMPDLRLGQLLCNIFRGNILACISNSELITVLKQYYSEVK